MGGNKLFVDINPAFPVDCAEMKEHPFSAEGFGKSKDLFIPKALIFAYPFAYAGKAAFNGERNADFAVKAAAPFGVFIGYCIIEHSVEVQPVIPHHLRARIFRKRIFAHCALGPAGF